MKNTWRVEKGMADSEEEKHILYRKPTETNEFGNSRI
jgi:hypothetical protein